ncbi:DEAD/DEAH box helicase family protein, partial [Candidatus Bathyarchaeota archaeon]|nr:DEAD/DEAH box helicase family protein [Candidatus Bathyarchaeota archaeon]
MASEEALRFLLTTWVRWKREPLAKWTDYLRYLEESPYSVRRLISDLSPERPLDSPMSLQINSINYKLWPFQQRVLDRISGNTLILGLPTGLGKTFVAGAYLWKESLKQPIRVLFLVPSIPLGVQQTIFARRMLNLKEATFISGELPPKKRLELKVWNNPYVVCTPQTFYNDWISPFEASLRSVKSSEEDISALSETLQSALFTFPFDIVVADECQRYVGETEGYSVLLAAKACGTRILALSATPQLHAPERLRELKRIFNRIEVFSVEDPEVREKIPRRLIKIVRVPTPPKLLEVYEELGKVVSAFEKRIVESFGTGHLSIRCKDHRICLWLRALQSLRFRIVEDGASSVIKYSAWKLREFHMPLESLGGKNLYQLYLEALKEKYNHKMEASLQILRDNPLRKTLVFGESVEAIKQLGMKLQDEFGIENVAILVGKGSMSMDQQASALLHFRERARILVATSVAEEGLDIPSADLEIWLDPPGNPRKWIQRFGRVLRQPGGKEFALIYALVSTRTHERSKLMATMRKTEHFYHFTQEITYEDLEVSMPKSQTTLTQFGFQEGSPP